MNLNLSFDQALLIVAAMRQGIANAKGTVYDVHLAQSIINAIHNSPLDPEDVQNR